MPDNETWEWPKWVHLTFYLMQARSNTQLKGISVFVSCLLLSAGISQFQNFRESFLEWVGPKWFWRNLGIEKGNRGHGEPQHLLTAPFLSDILARVCRSKKWFIAMDRNKISKNCMGERGLGGKIAVKEPFWTGAEWRTVVWRGGGMFTSPLTTGRRKWGITQSSCHS